MLTQIAAAAPDVVLLLEKINTFSVLITALELLIKITRSFHLVYKA
jgi:hypothetical protein